MVPTSFASEPVDITAGYEDDVFGDGYDIEVIDGAYGTDDLPEMSSDNETSTDADIYTDPNMGENENIAEDVPEANAPVQEPAEGEGTQEQPEQTLPEWWDEVQQEREEQEKDLTDQSEFQASIDEYIENRNTIASAYTVRDPGLDQKPATVYMFYYENEAAVQSMDRDVVDHVIFQTLQTLQDNGTVAIAANPYPELLSLPLLTCNLK